MEEWRSLEPDFPGYSVSSLGRVMKNATGRDMAQSKNNTGHMKVAMLDHENVRRTVEVSRLVAFAFVDGYSNVFNAPIYLDGNKEHTFADNLAWRPRWFAVKYHRQFRNTAFHISAPIVETTTRQRFRDSLEAVKACGVLEVDILRSVTNGTSVFPTGHQFRFDD